MRSFVVALVVLCTASVQAQPGYFEGPGAYGVLGNAAPERLPLNRHVDPDLVLGARLSDNLDLHVGLGSESTEWDVLRFDGPDLADVRRYDHSEITKTRALTLAYTGRLGGPQVRGSVSLGYDSYRLDRFTARPDSFDQRRRPQREFGLVTFSQESWSGSFLTTGASAAIATHIGRSRFRISPGLGVAVSASTRLDGDVPTQRARVMPFLHFPVTARFERFAVTYEVTTGFTRGTTARSYELLTGRPLSRNLVPVVSGALRVNV